MKGILCVGVILLNAFVRCQLPQTSVTWKELIPEGNIWSGRNAHASCIFLNKIWLVGGHSDLYPTYNLEFSDKTADVWWSSDAENWNQITGLRGDFYAQNQDALQPGPVAPWYARYGHGLDAVDIDNDEVDDLMILTGGFAPSAMNDVWVTEDGITWFFVHYAPWSPRGWHGSVVYNNTLWIMGGTPLNSEVWVLRSIYRVDDREPPLTRAMYMPYTYGIDWEQLDSAPWSPRCGMGLVNQPYPDSVTGSRMVFAGGYGGWLEDDDRFDGLRSQGDVWFTEDGKNWTMIASQTEFGELAWFGMAVLELGGSSSVVPRMWIVGGGFIGDFGNKRVSKMSASVSVYWSVNGSSWTMVNYRQGGGSSPLELYSSSEWAETIIDGELLFLGLWGLTLEVFPSSEGPDTLYILGGDQDGDGTVKDVVYKGMPGLLCDRGGVPCNNL